MFSRTVRLKNATASTVTVEGIVIAPGTYYDVDPSEIPVLAASSQLFSLIGSGDVVVNRGADGVDDIADPLQGWKWLAGDFLFPTAPDGSILVTSSATPSTPTDLFPLSVTFAATLASSSYHDEILVIPPGGELRITLVAVSAKESALFSLDRFVWDAVTSQWVSVSSTADWWVNAVLELAAPAAASDTVLSVAYPAPSSIARAVTTGTMHAITDWQTDPPVEVLARLTAFDSGAMTVTLDRPLGVSMPAGARITRVERPILNVVAERGSSETAFVPPLVLRDAPNSYIRVRIEENANKSQRVSFNVFGFGQRGA